MNDSFEKVLTYFQTLTTIPRGSNNCEGICRYLCDFARQHALLYRTDSAGNVVIVKPASEAFKHKSPVILQGHTDMVCAREDGCDIDFLRDALRLCRDGDYLYADGTSLGGDDGIAVAMMLALLDSDVPLPQLECIFTADEEIGMIGATALDMSDIEGKYLINIDSEDEGVLTVSCAGGSTAVVSIPIAREKIQAYVYDIAIAGLAGGHSGTEIIKGGLNANKLAGEVLRLLPACRIVTIGGGEKENAIAVRADMRLAFEKPVDCGAVLGELKERWKNREPNISICVEEKGLKSVSVMSEESAGCVKSALFTMPQGIIKKSEFDENAVQTSLNLGVMEQNDTQVSFTFCVRSSVKSEREALEKVLGEIAAANGGTLSIGGIYPGWEYKQNSVLRDTAVAVFEKLYGCKPKCESIHAGLECGVLISKKPDLECISLGPQMYDVHTARERLSVSSAERTWKYLLALIRAL